MNSEKSKAEVLHDLLEKIDRFAEAGIDSEDLPSIIEDLELALEMLSGHYPEDVLPFPSNYHARKFLGLAEKLIQGRNLVKKRIHDHLVAANGPAVPPIPPGLLDVDMPSLDDFFPALEGLYDWAKNESERISAPGHPLLNDTLKHIFSWVGKEPRTGGQIAELAGYRDESAVRRHLSTLKQLGYIANGKKGTGQGYYRVREL